MEWVEASGKSLVEAKETVLDLLGVAEDDAEFVVLSEPKAGLFGRLRGEARVQARVRPVAPPPKRGRRQRPERRREGSGGSGRSPGDDSPSQNGSGQRSSQSRHGGRQGQGGNDSNGTTKAISGDGGLTGHPTSEGSEAKSGSRSSRRSREGSGSRAGATAASDLQQQVKRGPGRKPEESEGTVEETLTIEQQGEAGRDFLSGLIREFGLTAEVNYREIDEETVEVSATGEDLGLLVGPRGATLSAVQDLTRTFVQRQSENRTDRILVDVAGYREKRSAALRRFAEGIVNDVKETGAERALEPMSASDRKVIHDAVNEIDGVQTRSEGDEPSRYIVIEPTS